MVVPSTLDDFEQLLNYSTVATNSTDLMELQADDFYFDTDYWLGTQNQVKKNTYIWAEDIYGTSESNTAWGLLYSKVFYANAVLDGLTKLERTTKNSIRYDQIKGEALFLKAEAIYGLVQLFSPVYDREMATRDLGIPIPMTADVNEKMERPTNRYTFDFIVNSLLEAEPLLKSTADFSRASKPAANALLARVYLYMGEYDKAGLHSDYSLRDFNDLVDLNVVSKRDYQQTLLFRYLGSTNDFYNSIMKTTIMDSVLMQSYVPGDLRERYFFENIGQSKYVKKDYHGLGVLIFNGFDADEQYLIRAECYARAGDKDKALTDLNHLLEHRFETDEFVPYTSTNKEEVLQWVLEERRKELVFRGLRWSDLKRLNRDGYAISLQRNLSGEIYTLPAGDKRWVFPIPPNEIKITGIQQNER
ncbi:SusD family protein [Sphingobacterium nematocida]|uniref:SusD family protein n=2 Tax=Sphingobacterium nematocida TaxID=1513896 RepID=A0A1T5DVZ5_9SPHI|nr:SusD family protein [Sphingobacterium nematocida]